MLNKVQIYVVRIRAHGGTMELFFDRSPHHSEVIEAVREVLHNSLHPEVFGKDLRTEVCDRA